MRCVVIREPGPPSALRVEDREPPRPGVGEVSIDVAYAGAGFVDTLFRAGAFPFPTQFIPGIEVTGLVREVGTDVVGLEAGQPVAALPNDFGEGQSRGRLRAGRGRACVDDRDDGRRHRSGDGRRRPV